MLPNVSVALNINKLPHYVHVSGTCCTHLVAFIDWWCLFMKHMWCHLVAKYTQKGISSYTWLFQVVSAAQCVRYQLPHYVHLAGTGCKHLLALYWLMVFIHETHVTPSSGKVKTKRHLFSYLVISVSECCPMCQLLQTRTNYYITYIFLLQVAFILWHYIDWWCLFMKPIWCLLVAK